MAADAERDRPAFALSGGNQRSSSSAGELGSRPQVLLAAHPAQAWTSGRRRRSGVSSAMRRRISAVLLISADLEADRVVGHDPRDVRRHDHCPARSGERDARLLADTRPVAHAGGSRQYLTTSICRSRRVRQSPARQHHHPSNRQGLQRSLVTTASSIAARCCSRFRDLRRDPEVTGKNPCENLRRCSRTGIKSDKPPCFRGPAAGDTLISAVAVADHGWVGLFNIGVEASSRSVRSSLPSSEHTWTCRVDPRRGDLIAAASPSAPAWARHLATILKVRRGVSWVIRHDHINYVALSVVKNWLFHDTWFRSGSTG